MNRPRTRLLATVVLSGALLLSACGGDTAAVDLVSVGEGHVLLAEAPEGLVVLDVRTPEEFAESRLAGAININVEGPGFEEAVGDLDEGAPVFVYCRTGRRAATAITIMQDLGFTDLYDLDGGIVSWTHAGLPTER
jgi:rhodanese-related sulfurtransferase